MKKLMTMLATAAMAFGLYAAETPSIISGAGFDSSDKKTETPSLLTWNTSGFVAGFWTGTNAENAVITAGECLSDLSLNRPARFLSSDDPGRAYDQYLAIATKPGEEVGANILSTGEAQPIGANGLYFDGLVKFTAFDEFPTIADDAKIAVFPMLNDPEDESAGTNLYVKAWGTSTNIWKTATSIDDEDWHRVTIKAISDILAGDDGTQVGFVVYVDGEMIGLPLGVKSDFKSATLTPEANYYNNNGFLFGALGTYSASLTQVGFSGKGGIDEIVFTEVAPDFAKSPTFATINVGSYISSFTIYENGVSAGTYTDFPITIEKKDGVAYTYTYIAAPGYVSVKAPTSLNLAQGSASIENATAAAALLGDEGYATIAAAVAEANKATGPVVLKIVTVAPNDKDVALLNENVLLDLNGQTIGDLGGDSEEDLTFTITNSNDSVDGVVNGALNFNADVKVTNVKFSYTNNSTLIGESLVTVAVPDGYELKEDTEDPHQYYVITERIVKGTVIFICDKPAINTTVSDVAVGTTIASIAPAEFGFAFGSWTNAAGVAVTEVAEGTIQLSPSSVAYDLTKVGDAYQIAAAADFQKLQAIVAAGFNCADESFVLANDVDMSGIAWEGIGEYNGTSGNLDKDFRGTLNGAGFTIRNITFARGEYYGFFNQLENATISNITFNVAGFADGEATSYGAGVIGNWVTGTTFDHVTVTGTLTGTHNVAGFVIKACGGTEFIDCVNNATLTSTGTKRVAGFVGFESSLSGGFSFTRCVNNGNVTVQYTDSADYGVGGFVGGVTQNNITFTDCVNNGAVTVNGYESGTVRWGAFIGVFQPAAGKSVVITATNCSMKKVVGLDAVGGVNTSSGGALTINGFYYATAITDSTVTFSQLAQGGTFTLMKADLAPAFTLEAIGDTITFKTNLFEAASFAGIVTSDPETIVLKEEADANGVTFTAVAKQTDPIPPLPDNPTADQVNAAVDAAKFADTTVKTMIGGDPAKYTAFKTWADGVTGGEAAVVASAHAADSYLLGQTKLLQNAPASEIKTIAKTSDTALTLTFEIKDGANAVEVAQAAADYVKTLVQCNEKVDFGNGTKIDATVGVAIDGTTLTATVTLPPNKPAAFMKVAK